VKRETNVTDDGTTASATFDFRVRALSPIPVFPDTIRILWFDVNENRERHAILPAQRIQIGMPDREALLAAVGEKRSALDRLIEHLQSAGYRSWLLPAAALLFLISLAFALTQVKWRARARRSALRKQHRALRSRIEHGEHRAALKLLRNPPRDVVLTDTGRALREDCERQVFSKPPTERIVWPDDRWSDDPVFAYRKHEPANQLLPGL
jgi:hypothetical protein